MSWQILSRLAAVITEKDAGMKQNVRSVVDPNLESSDTSGRLTTRVTYTDHAVLFHAEPGEDIKGVERNIPGANFPESLRIFLRLIGLPLGMPLELILLDWTRSNYSQSRAVLEQAFANFVFWQTKMRAFFFTPLFNWKLNHWSISNAAGRIVPEWIMPLYPWIDQLKEAQAQSLKVERGFVTHGQVCKSLNLDRDEVVTARQAEITDAIQRAEKIKEKTGVTVPWQHLAGIEIKSSSGVTSPSSDEETNDETEEREDLDDERQDDNESAENTDEAEETQSDE
jgi:capsid protein